MTTEVLGNAVVSVRAVLDKLDQDLANGRKKVEGGLEKWKKGIAKTAGAIGAAAGGALTFGLVRHLDIEKANDKVAAEFGLDPEAAAEMGETAGKLYADAYGESLTQVSDAAAQVERALGGSQDEIEGLTKNALDFGTAFGTDVSESVAAASFLIKNGLAKDGQEAFDLLTVGFQKLPPAVRDELLAATQEYSQFLGALGVTGEEAFGLMVAAAERGGNFGVDKVGDALKELTIRATDMSAASVDAYELAGLEAEEMAARFLAGGSEARGALTDLISGLQGIEDPVKRSNAAIALFGTPLEDLSVTEIPAFLDQLASMGGGLGDVAGAADKMGDTLNDNAATKLEAYRRQMESAVVDFVGGKVLPALESLPGPAAEVTTGLVGIGGGAVSALAPLGQLTGGFKGFGKQLAKIPKGVGNMVKGTTKGIGKVAKFAGKGTTAFAKLSVSAVKSGIKVAVAVAKQVAAWALLGVQSLIHAAKVAAAWLISMGPIILVGAAVVGLVALIIKNWDTIKRVTAALWDGIKKGVAAAWDWITGKVRWALDLVKSWFLNWTVPGLIVKHWDTIKAGARAAWDWITGKVQGFISFFTGIPGRIRNIARGMFDGIKNAFRSALNWVIDAWNGLQFRIPGFDPPGPGPKFGGFTLGVPNIPRLAMGGSVLDGGVAQVGEFGRELVFLPSGAEVMSNTSSDHLLSRLAGGGSRADVTKVYVDGRELFEIVRDRQDDNDRRNGRGRRGGPR